MSGLPLKNIQANILKGHEKARVLCLFIQFDKGKEHAIKAWLRQFVIKEMGITSAHDQMTGGKPYQKTVKSFFLSVFAYEKLGIAPKDRPQDPAFLAGMKKRGEVLNDPPPKAWESVYQSELDALLLLADNSISKLMEWRQKISDSLANKKIGAILFAERGNRLKQNGLLVEQFGFADCVSQKEFWNAKGALIDQTWKSALVWRERRQINFGSYLVFRKLEQNVKRFNAQIRLIARKIEGISDDEKPRQATIDYVGAQAIGRYKNGTPLSVWYPARPNDFKYLVNGDPSGAKCPFHAHIRKINPRDGEYRIHEIIRRSIPFGSRADDLSDEPETGVGMLFMCFQEDIVNHFEVLQKRCNDPYIEQGNGKWKKFTGLDPICGQANQYQEGQNWHKDWNNPLEERYTHNFAQVVALKGGEYFYAPTIKFLSEII